MSGSYGLDLDAEEGVALMVDFSTIRREVTDYAVVLLLELDDTIETIRVYDGAHGYNEMHRYTRSAGKQAAAPFHAGTLGEGMHAAIADIKRSYGEMIEGWRRQ